jgi:hypothetical protein
MAAPDATALWRRLGATHHIVIERAEGLTYTKPRV